MCIRRMCSHARERMDIDIHFSFTFFPFQAVCSKIVYHSMIQQRDWVVKLKVPMIGTHNLFQINVLLSSNQSDM